MPSNKNNRFSQKNYTPLQRRIIFSACIGNILKWYDFTLWIMLASWTAPVLFMPSVGFFSAVGDMMAIMLCYACFYIGYVFRPVGALLCGYISRDDGLFWLFIG